MIMRHGINALGVNYRSESLDTVATGCLIFVCSCSVACATLHRATHPPLTDDAPSTTVAVESSTGVNGLNTGPVSGTVSAAGARNPFSILEDAKELQTVFMMYPRLRSQLRDIYAATLPPLEITSGITSQYEYHHQAERGRGKGRARIGRGERGPWNSDRGTQDGIDALSNAKEQYGKGGEGIREYAELVLKLVSMEGADMAQLVQEEVAEENAKIIAQLLNGDPF